MDRSKWERTLTRFQALARGHLVRKEICRARQDFEDIVNEIDGGLAHLQWRETIIPIPHFTDTEDPLLQPDSDDSKPPDPGLDARAHVQSPAAAAAAAAHPSSDGGGEDHRLPLQRTEAERDESQTKTQTSLSIPVRGDGEGGNAACVVNSTGDATSIWSSSDLDIQSHSRLHADTPMSCLAQEAPRTPVALRLHRDNLTMELLWLQQAIGSRKKYLSVKKKLSVS